MVSLLTDGLQDSVDVTFYQRNSVFTTLMAFYQSKLATKQIKVWLKKEMSRTQSLTCVFHGFVRQQ